MTKNIPLNPDQLAKLSEYESSISHWSSEHAILSIKAKKVLAGLESLYDARQKMLADIMDEAKVERSKVAEFTIDESGSLILDIKD